jgi:hypothetical protein
MGDIGAGPPPCLPDFIVIGGMKCATTTLHEQLARQPGIVMSRPKEPNFFSDDDTYTRGLGWYGALFGDAPEGVLCGESSTHYTKLPTHPHTVERMARAIPRPMLIYLIRHPIDRLISHYVHELTTGRISVGIDEAVDRHPELVDYGRYAMQLRPYFEAFGAGSILPVFTARLSRRPQGELERIFRFLGAPGKPRWDHDLGPLNAGRDRLRPSPVREALVRVPVLTPIRQTLLPRSWTESIKGLWRARIEPPRLAPATLRRLRDVFDEDLARLGEWLGLPINCDTFAEATR